MKQSFILLWVLLTTLQHAYTQKISGPNGTIVIGIIVPDGILLVSDSRGAFYASYDHRVQVGYMDSVIKIYKLKQFMIGMSGQSFFDNEPLWQIVDNFNHTSFYDTSLRKTVYKFNEYLDNHFPSILLDKVLMAIIGVGYVNGSPEMIEIKRKDTLYSGSGAVFNDPQFDKYLVKYASYNLPIYNKVEEAIKDYAISEGKQFIVGGPISIVKVFQENKIQWVQNDFSMRKFSSSDEVRQAIIHDKIDVHYLVPNGKETLLGSSAQQ